MKTGFLHDLIQNWLDADDPADAQYWQDRITAHCEIKGGEVTFIDDECHLDPPDQGWGYVYSRGGTP